MRAELIGLSIGVGNGEAYYVSLQGAGSGVDTAAAGQMTLEAAPKASAERKALPWEVVRAKLGPVFRDSAVAKYRA